MKIRKFFVIFSIPIFISLIVLINFSKLNNYTFNTATSINNFSEKEIRFLLVGDIMMARSVEGKIKDLNKKFVFPFLNILNYLKSFDYVIANLEGPISDNGIKVGSKYSFRMKPEVAEALSNANIKVVNLANNHIFDYGKIAFEDTLKNLEKNNIKHFGNSYEPLIIEKEGVKIGFLGFSDFLKHLEVKENKIGITVANSNLSEIIKKAKERVDILIVSFHWGEEYQKLANERQRKLAKIAIDSGADLVVGHHPHFIQDIEKYKDKFIFYSLGNFIFDQNFSKETMIGGGVEVYIKTQTNADKSNLPGYKPDISGNHPDNSSNKNQDNLSGTYPVLNIQNIYFRKFYLNDNSQIENMSERLIPYKLENRIYLFREAKTPEEWQKGLMFVKKPSDYDGMIFVFPDRQIRSFWNQNTFVDLDIYWLDNDKIIGMDKLESIEKTKNVKTIQSPGPVNKVIELITTDKH
jgi:poly-gamma-glutamate synthesis protein (capsule biosynthesis protein)